MSQNEFIFCKNCAHSVLYHTKDGGMMHVECSHPDCKCLKFSDKNRYPNSYDEKPLESAKYEHIEGVLVEKPATICVKCGGGACGCFNEDMSLSLLVIDAGHCCFLKVESGRLERTLFDDDIGGLGFRIIQHPFAAVRDAIDSQDKPVPRIERADVSGNERYRVVWNDSAYPIPVNVLDALSGVVGKPLPIYTPSEHQGTWTQLFPLVNCATLAQEKQAIQGQMDALPITVYRYTRN